MSDCLIHIGRPAQRVQAFLERPIYLWLCHDCSARWQHMGVHIERVTAPAGEDARVSSFPAVAAAGQPEATGD